MPVRLSPAEHLPRGHSPDEQGHGTDCLALKPAACLPAQARAPGPCRHRQREAGSRPSCCLQLSNLGLLRGRKAAGAQLHWGTPQ